MCLFDPDFSFNPIYSKLITFLFILALIPRIFVDRIFRHLFHPHRAFRDFLPLIQLARSFAFCFLLLTGTENRKILFVLLGFSSMILQYSVFSVPDCSRLYLGIFRIPVSAGHLMALSRFRLLCIFSGYARNDRQEPSLPRTVLQHSLTIGISSLFSFPTWGKQRGFVVPCLVSDWLILLRFFFDRALIWP